MKKNKKHSFKYNDPEKTMPQKDSEVAEAHPKAITSENRGTLGHDLTRTVTTIIISFVILLILYYLESKYGFLGKLIHLN